jgi:hypothetical protein
MRVSVMPGAPAPTAWWCPRSTATCCGDVGWPRPASTGVPDRDRRTEDRRTDAKRAHNRRPGQPARSAPSNQEFRPSAGSFVAGHVSRAPGSSSVKEKLLEVRVSKRVDDRILPSARSRSAAAREIPRPSATSLSGRTGMAATSSTRTVTGRPGQPGIGSASRTHAPSQSTVSRFR